MEEGGGMSAVHLGMMELKGDSEDGFKEAFPVFSPYHKGVVEYAAIHTDRSVYIGLGKRGGTDDHAVGQIVVFAALGNLPRQCEIISIEFRQIPGERNIAGTYFTGFVGYDGIYRNGIVLYKFVPHREHVEFFHPACRFSDTPAHQHIEFHSFPFAEFNKPRHIECLEESHHRHGRFHPHFKRISAGGFSRIYFFHFFGIRVTKNRFGQS